MTVDRHGGSGSGHVVDGPDPARVIRTEDLVAAPWPNGRGWTSEIYRQPSVQRPGQPVWRLSLATIDTTGPFSVLPGARRRLLLASHTAVQLSIDGTVHVLRYTDSVGFDGSAAVEVIALSGTARALNLMTYGGVGGDLQVSRMSGNSDWSVRDAAALVVLDGRLVVRQEVLGRYDTVVLGPRSLDVGCEAATVARVGVGGMPGDLPRPTSGGWAGGIPDRGTEPLTPMTEQRGD
jgi:environmental stress-induced protein Ves